MSDFLTRALVAAIRGYQLMLSPLLGARCRFAPSCSSYTAEAIAAHGPGRGLALGVRRFCRCHPWGASGFDPVPSVHALRPEVK